MVAAHPVPHVQGCQVWPFRGPKKTHFGFFLKLVGRKIFENLLSSWPFLKSIEVYIVKFKISPFWNCVWHFQLQAPGKHPGHVECLTSKSLSYSLHKSWSAVYPFDFISVLEMFIYVYTDAPIWISKAAADSETYLLCQYVLRRSEIFCFLNKSMTSIHVALRVWGINLGIGSQYATEGTNWTNDL